ncbi:MAG: T9SS type A sorting domain-containing protein, partial [candidate division Zixibacteria bacterium]|nr:T9SS type A sorting domain-containing protein [candidate division Zixibacteria bacterium]
TSWETAAHVVQDAADAASRGDTIYVGAGEYNQTIRIPDTTDHLSIIGMGMDSTFIWRNVVGEYIVYSHSTGADDIFIKGIHFEARCVCIVGGLYTDLINVENCKFTGDGQHGGAIGSGVYGTSFDVKNCIFEDIIGITTPFSCDIPFVQVRNCLFNSSPYTDIWVCGHKVIVENNISINPHYHFFEWDAIPGMSIDTLIFTNNQTYGGKVMYYRYIHSWDQINNNTSFISVSGNHRSYRLEYVDTLVAYNNSITGGGIGIEIFDSYLHSYVDLRYNNLKNDIQNINVIGDIGNIDTSIIYHEFPMFVGVSDYHLQAYSPLIDAGHPDILDINGTRSDIGCYGGPGGESYDYQDLPPLIPDSITYEVFADSILFIWLMNEEFDFNRYVIYGDTISGFEPSVFNLIAEPETSFYKDENLEHSRSYYYRFASIDNQDNQSDYSDEIEATTTGINDFINPNLPRITSITSNYPNPFNSSTTIVYHVANLGPVPAQIEIEVYDILGRKVRLLVNERREVGIHKIIWDGRDSKRNELPSGVYFVRISQWGISVMNKPRKIILLK